MMAYVYLNSRVMDRRAARMAELTDKDSETEEWLCQINDEDERQQQEKELQGQGQGRQQQQQEEQEDGDEIDD